MTTKADQGRPTHPGRRPLVPPAAAVTVQLLRQARQALVCDAASILVWTGDGPVRPLAASDVGAGLLDQLQILQGEGPALTVRRELDVVLSGNVRADHRWPRWGPAVADRGWRSALSAPLRTSEHALAVLNLYAHRISAFDATHAYAARIFAEHAAAALGRAEEGESLREALDSRHRISLAQGIVMEQHGVDVEQAFELLRRQTESSGLKLLEVADQVLAAASFRAPTRRGPTHQ